MYLSKIEDCLSESTEFGSSKAGDSVFHQNISYSQARKAQQGVTNVAQN